MITDFAAFVGPWPFHPVAGDPSTVAASLRQEGVERIFASPLEAAWCRDPHLFNERLYQWAAGQADVRPVPVLDPTVPTWPRELSAASAAGVCLVRLLPNYSPYGLEQADDLLRALAAAGMGVIVQLRLEDTRRHHPLAQVPDVPAADVAALAARHPDLTVILGGARTAEARALRDALRSPEHFYLETSQLDGTDAVRSLVDSGLGERLLLGSHAPLFVPRAALARVLTDLPDDAARRILHGNAERLLRRLGGGM